MQAGIPYDSEKGRAICAALTAHPHRRELRHQRRDGRASWARSPATSENKPDMLRVIRNHRRAAYDVSHNAAGRQSVGRVREAGHRARRHRRRPVRRQRPDGPPRHAGRRPRMLGPRPDPGRAPRLSQRPDHRDRADRHHRPAHGLRHHRRRARLRPGEVQEAGRRRVLQDRQPVAPPRPGQPRLRAASRSTTSSSTSWARSRCTMRRTSSYERLKRLGLHRRRAGEDRGRPARRRSRSPSPSAPGRWARTLFERLEIPEAEWQAPNFNLLRRLGFTKQADRRGQRRHLRPRHRRRRAAPEGRAPARLRLRQQVRQARQAVHPRRRPHPHDGRGPAVHQRRDLQDDQPPQRGHRRGHQEQLPAELEAGPQGQRPLPRRLQALASR